MKKIALLFFFTMLFVLCFAAFLKAQTVAVLQQGKPTSIRGLSVVDDRTAWVSGSKGWIAVTTDGGETWNWQQVKGFETADFRDIEAFSDKEAVIMSSGTPALILKTIDGGNSWQEKYRNADTAYFFDAMDFDSPQHGLVLGDPISGKFLMLETENGGESWNVFNKEPDALTGEAAFAASGTCLRVHNGRISIASGGSAARLITWLPDKKFWNYMDLPIRHGRSSQGAFSVAIGDHEEILTGGDYMQDNSADSVACSYSFPFINKLNPLQAVPSGFQSCVEFVRGSTFISTGTPGTNLTADGGKTWKKIDGISYNVCRRAKRGQLVLLAGNNGKIGRLTK